jgi:TolB-like protein
MFTDMIGYTALGQRNEALSLVLVDEQRKLIRPILNRHNGREVKTIGDAFLVEFHNALDAVRCAYDIQRATREFNVSLSEDKRIRLRIGLHLGDVIEHAGDISGDAVNVASRIEPLAEDGGVCLTRQVHDQTKGKFELPQVSIGLRTLKNVNEPIEVYKMVMPWEQAATTTAETYSANRIAILPFASLSPDPNDAYFAEGITDEIISAAAGISGLKVISRTSVMSYKGTTKRVEEIGRELKVGSILEGTFKKAGNRIRVTTQLINVADDEHLWAQNYDRTLDDVFEVQSDVAQKVADALRVRILSSEKERLVKRPTENASTYGLYLKGKNYLNKRGLEDLKKAREYFELAVHEDHDFALGYVGVSDCCALLRNNWGDEPEANLVRAKAMVVKALELDSRLAEAHATRGLLLHQEYDLRGAEQEFKKGIELKPSYAMAHMWYYSLLVNQVRWNEALVQIERAVELDPLAPVVYGNLGGYYLYKGDCSRAIGLFRKAIELGYVPAYAGVAQAYGLMKMADDMKREFGTYVDLNRVSEPLAQLYADSWMAFFMDDKDALSRLLPELEARFQDERGSVAYYIAAIHFYLGEQDKAFEWLERSYSRKEGNLLYIEADQLVGFFGGIQHDPRYLDLLKRLGLDKA